MENNYMDKIVRDALENIDVQRGSEWDRMDARLDEEALTRKRVLTAKGVELLLMGLAIWTIVRVVHIDTSVDTSPLIEQQQSTIPSQQQPTENIIPFNIKDIDNVQQEATTIPSDVPIADANKLDYENTPVISKLDKVAMTTTQDNNPNKPIFTNENHSFIDKNLHQTTTPSKVTIPNTLEQKDILIDNTVEAITLPLLVQKPIAELDNEMKMRKRWIKKAIQRPAKDKPLKFAAFLSPNINRIQTPDYVAVEKQSNSLGFTAGLNMNIELNGRVDIETGLNYTSLTYTERTVNDFQSASISGLNQVKFNIVEVPVNIQYNLTPLASKWKVYALAGATNHFVMTIRNSPKEFAMASGVQGNNASLSPNRLISDDGILEDITTFKQNYFVTTNFGLGIEYQLDKKWALFAQPTYRHALNKVGRHDDKFSSIALLAGTRVSL